MTDPARVVVDVQGAVAHVRLNRPEKLNALDLQMFEALTEAGGKSPGVVGFRC